MIKKKKKGMLLASEVVKLVIALIGIAILVYLLVSIYYTSVQDQKLNQAKDTISRIKDIVQRVDAGAVLSEKVTDVTPASWYVFSFVGSEVKPNSCVGQSCLCICDTPSFITKYWTSQIEKCDSDGVCLNIKNLNKFKEFKINSPSDGGTNIEISKSSGNIGVSNS